MNGSYFVEFQEESGVKVMIAAEHVAAVLQVGKSISAIVQSNGVAVRVLCSIELATQKLDEALLTPPAQLH